MVYRATWILVWLSFVPLFPVAADRLTLSQAYDLAVAQSEQLKITEAEMKAVEARYRQAAGGMWPEVDAIGTAVVRDETGDPARETEQYAAGIGATWTIFQGFRTLRESEARQVEGEVVRMNQSRYLELLYQDVADVFYLVIALENELSVLEETLVALEERVKELERRVALGRSRKADLLSSMTQLSDLRIDAEQIRGRRDAALEMLAFLTGKAPEALNPLAEGVLPDAGAIGRVLGSRGERADVIAAERSVEAAVLDLKAEDADRSATVEAGGNLYLWRDPEDEGDWDLVIRASLPVFDGGVRRADVAERAAEVEVRELRLAELRRVADRDVRMTTRQFESLLAQWAALQETLRVSRENVAIQRKDYELGRANNLDVLAALIQQYGLQRREAVLDMQVRAALVRLEVAAGGVTP